MADEWATQSTGISGPARNAAAVTPNDSTDLASSCRALYVGTGGTVSVVMGGGQTVSFTAPDGSVLPIIASRVNATGTTASGIVALW